MRFAIIYSSKDPAGINIINQIQKSAFIPEIPIIETNKEIVFADINKNPKLKEIDFLVFASKHQSEKKLNSLSIHAPGNFRNADFGGKPGKISSTSAFVLKYLFQKLNENFEKSNLKSDFQLTLECTHHGPLIEKPCCFIEIGSDKEQWENQEAGKIIADTILSLQNYDGKKLDEWIPCIGIGGPHYCPNFNKIQLNSKYAISHIITEYNLPLTESMLLEAEKKTSEDFDLVLLDWKGLGNSEQRQETINLIEHFGLKHVRTGSLEKD